MSDKHRGWYSPPPLKESRPKIRCEGLFKGREICYPIPTSASALGYLASSSREANWVRQLSGTHSTQKLLSEEFPSLTSMKHCYFGRNPRHYGTSFMVYKEYYKHGLTTRSIYLSSGIACIISDKGWIHIRGSHSLRLSEIV
jgi:hypothetical protein